MMHCKTEKTAIHVSYSFFLISYVLLIFQYKNVSVMNAKQ